MQADVQESEEKARTTAWLSHGLETLVAKLQRKSGAPTGHPDDFDFDVIIVGSGYGASVAAAELAGCTDTKGNSIKVCVLERGKEYLAGMFPSRMADLAGHVRFATPEAKRPKGVRDGLFDVRTSGDAVAVVANGLGGGSLINAGVMAMPHAAVFQEARWPQAIRLDCTLTRLAASLRTRLGAKTVTEWPSKTVAMSKSAGSQAFKLTRVTVANATGPNAAGVSLDECIACGDCATGCNHNAKDSLDLNLLYTAKLAEAEIYTGATVLRVEQADDADPDSGWVLHLNHTDEHLRVRQPAPFQVRARRVILAAGTLGSTEILMRSQTDKLKLSTQLGRKFSANGDMIAVGHDLNQTVNAVADEAVPPTARGVGPTITAMIDLRQGQAETDLVIQDLAIPGPLRRLFEESTTTSDVLNRLVDGDCRSHNGDRSLPDDAAVDNGAMSRSLVVAMIGRDAAEGELRMGSQPVCDDADGLLTVHWPELRHDPRFELHHETLGKALAKAKLGGRVISNLMWRPLSPRLEEVFGQQRGPLLTVHPLGGCAMGDSARNGVTDDCGRVFNAADSSMIATHDGLVVLDGSIVPGSLGINPALTIAVLALRAIAKLKTEWQLTKATPSRKQDDVQRPKFRTPQTISRPKPTQIELTEQMRGWVSLRTRDGRVQPYFVELTLTTEPVALDSLMTRKTATEGRTLTIAPTDADKSAKKGLLRILRNPPDAVTGQAADNDVLLAAEFSGSLRVFALGASNPFWRTALATWAWFRNRGLRDIAQRVLNLAQQWLRLLPPETTAKQGSWAYVKNYARDILRLCSRAGAVRLIEYELTIDKILPPAAGVAADWDGADFENKSIRGVKRMTYSHCSSPWTQLMDMSLQQFPQMVPVGGNAPCLSLNPRYLAQVGVPLFRVVGQQDHVAAMVDLFSFVLYAMRVVLQVHALSFRKPDAPSSRPALRLPGTVPGLPPPQIEWLNVGQTADTQVRIRLARYQGTTRAPTMVAAAERPVLLIHGYSASGTTFAHPAVPNGLAKTLCDAGRDVWVLDMRSSSGMPTARGNWAIEDMATYDIPIAIEHVLKVTSAEKVDVVAHCMGSAMFGMAVLAENDRNKVPNTLHTKIGRLVMSQIGPLMVLTPANVLRAYVMRYIRQYLPLEDYAFSPQGEISLAGQLLDRFLATLPMPPDEYRRENPMWPPGQATPWVGTRHRMDALYARDFSLNNLSDEVLDRIDDFFGPLSIDTVSQVIHFASNNCITDCKGMNHYTESTNLTAGLTFPMLSIHGVDNGLSDVATLKLMGNALEAAGVAWLNKREVMDDQKPSTVTPTPSRVMHEQIAKARAQLQTGKPSFMTWGLAAHGHQDCLIGKQAGENCKVIADFLT